MKLTKYLIVILIFMIILNSCRKIQQVSPVPHIVFKSFTVFDSIDPLGNFTKGGRLKFNFEDGDGDLGLNPGQLDSINLFFSTYKKIGESMVQITDTTDPVIAYKYRIPYMERLGQNKVLKGTISVAFLYLFYEPRDSNVIRYDFYIKDRALNESNVASTSEIALSVNKTYK
jgi:hypothetical protein